MAGQRVVKSISLKEPTLFQHATVTHGRQPTRYPQQTQAVSMKTSHHSISKVHVNWHLNISSDKLDRSLAMPVSMETRDVEFTWVETRLMALEVSGRNSIITVVDGMLCGGIMRSEHTPAMSVIWELTRQVWRSIHLLLAQEFGQCSRQCQSEYLTLESCTFIANWQNPSNGEMDTSSWGQPSANLSIPACKKDFDNHVIVFNIAFCGD